MLKSKLHLARITAVEPDYEGSLTIDRDLMDAIKLLPHEKILVSNMENMNRFETYAIPAKAGSRTICLNGPAARLGAIGDRLVILAFSLVPTDEARNYHPLILVLDKDNKAVPTRDQRSEIRGQKS